MSQSEKRRFINSHSLPDAYLQQASLWFEPVIETLVKHQKRAKGPILVAINGCQGSGKTTLADYFSLSFKAHGLRSVAISLDDFYLTHKQRQHLAVDTHPLLATRGVPGTHDVLLALETINALKDQNNNVSIPRFNKVEDDRFPVEKWSNIGAPVDVIILEGWCMGVEAQTDQDLVKPTNQLESLYDKDGKWRHYVNQQISLNYSKLWALIDCLIMLKAPNFDCVYQWRLEQEQKLSSSLRLSESVTPNKIMTPKQIKHFIQHYERLTRHSLAHLPLHCQHVFELSNHRQIINHRSPNPLTNDCKFSINTKLKSGEAL